MISERDVWATAVLMVKRYRDDAMLEAASRADQLLEDGDWLGAATWHRILNAIERLQAPALGRGRDGAVTRSVSRLIAAERLFPHKVDVPVPGCGLGKQLNDMFAWCNEHVATGTWESHGTIDPKRRDAHGAPLHVSRFYFMGEASARAFRRAWLPGSDKASDTR